MLLTRYTSTSYRVPISFQLLMEDSKKIHTIHISTSFIVCSHLIHSKYIQNTHKIHSNTHTKYIQEHTKYIQEYTQNTYKNTQNTYKNTQNTYNNTHKIHTKYISISARINLIHNSKYAFRNTHKIHSKTNRDRYIYI